MSGAPIDPDEYDGEHLNTDEKLREAGWAAGLDVLPEIADVYAERCEGMAPAILNAQLWSLQQAIRAHALAAVWRAVVFKDEGRMAPDLAIQAAAERLGVKESFSDYLSEN